MKSETKEAIKELAQELFEKSPIMTKQEQLKIEKGMEILLQHPEILALEGYHKAEWVSVEDRLPEEGKLVELCTTIGAAYSKAFEVYKVENTHQVNRLLYYRGTISKSTWDLKEWSHWRYYNEKDLPTPPKQDQET